MIDSFFIKMLEELLSKNFLKIHHSLGTWTSLLELKSIPAKHFILFDEVLLCHLGVLGTIKFSFENRMDFYFDIFPGPTSQLHSGIQQAREYEDPPGLMEKTEFLLRFSFKHYLYKLHFCRKIF